MVRPGGVVVLKVFGQCPSQVVLIDDQQPVEELSAQGADHPFADAFAVGAYGGLARILMPSAENTAAKELVNWPCGCRKSRHPHLTWDSCTGLI